MNHHTVDGRYLLASKRYPERILFRYLNSNEIMTLTYLNAAPQIAAIALALQQQGVSAGDRVVTYFDDIMPALLFCLAAAHLGAIIVPLPEEKTVSEISALFDRVSAKLVFTVLKKKLMIEAAGIACLCYDDCQSASRPDGEFYMSPLEACEFLEKISKSHDENHLYMVQPTSGSTGDVKLVMLTHRQMTYAADIALNFDICASVEPPERFLMVAKLNYGMGQINSITALALAAEMCVPNIAGAQCSSTVTADTEPRTTQKLACAVGCAEVSLNEVKKLDPSYICLTARLLQTWYTQHVAEGGENTSQKLFGPAARILTIGGAHTDSKILSYIHAQGVDIIECYGTIEVSLLIATPRGF